MFRVLIQLCPQLVLNNLFLLLMISLCVTLLYLMKSHFELFSHFTAFCAEIQTQFHVPVQILRSDNTKEHLSEPFQSFMLQHGILHKTSCVDTPSQNGVAERKNRLLLEATRALLFQMHVPKHFWAGTLSTNCFLINRMSSSFLNWETLYHQLFPNNPLFPIEPNVFGCTYLFGMSVHKSLNLIRSP